KGKRMVGTLTTDDGSGLRWIYGGNKGILTIPHPVQEGHYIVATSINSSAKRRVRFENGRLVLGIEVQAVMDAWGEGIFEPLAIAKYAPAIERDLAGMIEKNVRKTMERLQELKADIFGFGEELYRSSPKEWDKVAEGGDDVYAGAALESRARVTLRRAGRTRGPARPTVRWGGPPRRRRGHGARGGAPPRRPAPGPRRPAGTEAGSACLDRGLVDDGQNLGGFLLQQRPVAPRFHVEPQQRLGVGLAHVEAPVVEGDAEAVDFLHAAPAAVAGLQPGDGVVGVGQPPVDLAADGVLGRPLRDELRQRPSLFGQQLRHQEPRNHAAVAVAEVPEIV